MNEELLTLKYLISVIASDIDIKLLKDQSQTKDNEKEFYHRDEIRNQLKNTCRLVSKSLVELGFDIDVPLLITKSN